MDALRSDRGWNYLRRRQWNEKRIASRAHEALIGREFMDSHNSHLELSVVDRVAAALYERRAGRRGGWDSMPSFVQDNYRKDARVAINAVRDVLLDPTDAMIDAANRASPASTVVMLRSAIAASPISPNDVDTPEYIPDRDASRLIRI